MLNQQSAKVRTQMLFEDQVVIIIALRYEDVFYLNGRRPPINDRTVSCQQLLGHIKGECRAAAHHAADQYEHLDSPTIIVEELVRLGYLASNNMLAKLALMIASLLAIASTAQPRSKFYNILLNAAARGWVLMSHAQDVSESASLRQPS